MDIPTARLAFSRQGRYKSTPGRTVTFNTGIGYAPLFFSLSSLGPKKAPLKKTCLHYHNLDALKLSTEKEIPHSMKHNLTIPQAALVMNIYNQTKKGNVVTVYVFSEESKIFLTFSEDVRMYLLDCLNIHLKDDAFDFNDSCVVQ